MVNNANKKDRYVRCGYTADGRFVEDRLSPMWSYLLEIRQLQFHPGRNKAPDVCPECGEKCDFIDITCDAPKRGGSKDRSTFMTRRDTLNKETLELDC